MSTFSISKNDPERFKIKIDKFHFIILRSFGETEERLGGGGGGKRICPCSANDKFEVMVLPGCRWAMFATNLRKVFCIKYAIP